jgi:hypothetical protein
VLEPEVVPPEVPVVVCPGPPLVPPGPVPGVPVGPVGGGVAGPVVVEAVLEPPGVPPGVDVAPTTVLLVPPGLGAASWSFGGASLGLGSVFGSVFGSDFGSVFGSGAGAGFGSVTVAELFPPGGGGGGGGGGESVTTGPFASCTFASTDATSSHPAPSFITRRCICTSNPCPCSHFGSTQTTSSSALWNTGFAKRTAPLWAVSGTLSEAPEPAGPAFPRSGTCTEFLAALSLTVETADPTWCQTPFSSARSSTNCSDDPSRFLVRASSQAGAFSCGFSAHLSFVTAASGCFG